MAICARDLMQRDPVTLAPSMAFLEIQHLFVVAQISGAPVVDRGVVLGIISSTDLLRIADQACDDEVDVIPPEPAHPDHPAGPALPELLEAMTAADIVTPDPVWVTPDTPIDQVAKLMRSAHIHRVLVGEAGRLDGLISTFDLLAAIGQ
jgi:CBS domain-containing protein